MLFRDRTDAGRRLAELLAGRALDRPVVLGIPRGGLPVAVEVARAVHGDLAAIVARKLGAPGNPELAIGATTANGVYYLNQAAAKATGASDAYVAAERERQSKEAARREDLFDGHRRPPLAGRNVIVVDDGVATGATAIAAVRSAKAAGASRVILALPVGPPQTLTELRSEADEVVCLHEDEDFWAVGQYYRDFRPVEDREVLDILRSFAPVAADDSRDFTVTRGGVRLAGRLLTPSAEGPFPAVVFVHGLGSSKDSPRNVVVAQHLVGAGMAAILFDLSGHGDSSMDKRSGVGPYVDDLEAVFGWARQQPEIDSALVAVAGSSLGAVVTLEAVVEHRIRPHSLVLRAPPIAPEELGRLQVPALVIVGSADPLLADVRLGARGRKVATLSIVEGAGHLFEEAGTLGEAVRLTVEWLKGRLLEKAVATHSSTSVQEYRGHA